MTGTDTPHPLAAVQHGTDVSKIDERVRVGSIDGLRGAAVTAVVLYHFGWLPGGFLGVDLFFVVSGFVITRMLIQRQDGDESVTLGWFWRRRLRRLLPALLVVCGAVVIWTYRLSTASDAFHRQTVGEAVSALSYGNNWYDIYANVGYFDVALAKTPLNHLWSLSIEEQFYLVWPVLFILLARRAGRLRRLAVIAAVVAVGSALLQPLLFAHDGYVRPYLGTDSRVDAILVGALLGLAFTRSLRRGPVTQARALPATRVLGWLGLAELALAWALADVSAPLLYRGGLVLTSLAAAGLLLAVVADPRGWLTRVFSLPPLVGLGRASYSLYLWHLPIIVLVNPQSTHLSGATLTLLRLALIAVTTAASYFLVERPIHLRGLSVPRTRTALLATAAVFLGAAVAPGVLAKISATSRPGPSPTHTYARSFSRAEIARQTIMVVGDSWGLRTEYQMTQMPAPKPKRIVQEAQPSCGIADPVNEYAQNGATFRPTSMCLAWRTTWRKQIASADPTIVIMQVGNWDQARQQFTRNGPWLTPCDSAYQSRYTQHLNQALSILTARHAAVFVPTVRDNDGDRSKSDCMNSMLRAAVARHSRQGVHVLDLQNELCPGHRCRATIGGLPTYDDTGHIAVNVLPAVNNWIFDAMGNVLGTHRPAVDWWTGTKQSLTVPTTAPALSSATAPPPDLAASLPAPSVLTGASSTRHDLAAENVLAGVPVVVSGSSYRSIVADLAVSHAAAAFATSARMAVATLTYRTDQAANRAALAIQAVLLNAGAALHVDSDNLKYLALTNGNSITTIGFLRGPQSLSVVVTTSADATTEQVRARNALRTIGSNRGIPLP